MWLLSIVWHYLSHDEVVEAQQAQHTQPQPAPHCPVLVILCCRSAARQNITFIVSQLYPNHPERKKKHNQKLMGEWLCVQSLQVEACCPLSAAAVLPEAKASTPLRCSSRLALARFTWEQERGGGPWPWRTGGGRGSEGKVGGWRREFGLCACVHVHTLSGERRANVCRPVCPPTRRLNKTGSVGPTERGRTDAAASFTSAKSKQSLNKHTDAHTRQIVA